MDKPEDSGNKTIRNLQKTGNKLGEEKSDHGIDTPMTSIESTKEKGEQSKYDEGINASDVLCGKSKFSCRHVGNKRFRQIVDMSIEKYCASTDKTDRANLIQSIVDKIRESGGRFMRKNYHKDRWLELNPKQCREKVSHAMRDALRTSRGQKRQERIHQDKKRAETHSELLQSSNPSDSAIIGFPPMNINQNEKSNSSQHTSMVPEQLKASHQATESSGVSLPFNQISPFSFLSSAIQNEALHAPQNESSMANSYGIDSKLYAQSTTPRTAKRNDSRHLQAKNSPSIDCKIQAMTAQDSFDFVAASVATSASPRLSDKVVSASGTSYDNRIKSASPWNQLQHDTKVKNQEDKKHSSDEQSLIHDQTCDNSPTGSDEHFLSHIDAALHPVKRIQNEFDLDKSLTSFAQDPLEMKNAKVNKQNKPKKTTSLLKGLSSKAGLPFEN